MDESAAQPADWLPYRVREAFTFFELACLLNRRDPQRVFDAAIATDLSDQAKLRGIKGTGEPERPAYPFDSAEVVRARLFGKPEWLLPDDVVSLLSVFNKATGMQMQAAVSAQCARELAAALGIEWPGELEAAQNRPAGKPVRQARGRAHPLNAVTALAESKAADPDDWISVWAALVSLAESRDRPPPLLGYSEGEGVKYTDLDKPEGIAHKSKDAFRQSRTRSRTVAGGR